MEILGQEVRLPDRSTSPTPALTPSGERIGDGAQPVCSLCLSGPGRYTCPRCNAPYCSLACYRGPRHETCSEAFYRDSVLEVLRAEQAEPQGKRQMEEMLLKMREEEAAEEQAVNMGAVHELNEEEAGLWGSLTQRERQDFLRLLKSGDIGALVPEWRPWWEAAQLSSNKDNAGILELPGGELNLKSHPEKLGRCPELPSADGEKCQDAQSIPKPVSLQEQGADKVNVLGWQEGEEQNKTSGQETFESQGNQKMERPGTKTGTTSHGRQACSPNKKDCANNVCGSDTERTEIIQDNVSEGDATGRSCPNVAGQPLLSSIPPAFSSIPPLRSLSSNPSHLVQFSVVNAIYGYAFSLCRHNGDLDNEDMLLDFTGTLLGVSGTLSSAVVYNDTVHALQSAIRAASDPLLGGDEGGACSAIEATSLILLGDGSKTYSLAALAHTFHVLRRVRKLISEDERMRRVVFNAKKKCMFLAAWVNENDNHLPILSEMVRKEYQQHLEYMSGLKEISSGLQKIWGGKRPPQKRVLIEDVSAGTA
ncbi:zinc finger HIT domain-containing protein 2 [Spea bombifrons]|uniref:zinc finger HIT domain-containing protein 2 n=1 Tax=Spea bombifrons TaxID=233779 RepID=UPI00234BBEF8|nr:zinc finger HIT domain-containing protein 2 [Spea bombifrons]